VTSTGFEVTTTQVILGHTSCRPEVDWVISQAGQPARYQDPKNPACPARGGRGQGRRCRSRSAMPLMRCGGGWKIMHASSVAS
jgi:hypothetical protein